MQRVLHVKNAQIQAGNSISSAYVPTGAITNSKPWIDMALIMLDLLAGITNPKFVYPQFREIGLATIAKGVMLKMGKKDNITGKEVEYSLESLSFPLDAKRKKQILRRWEAYKRYYDKG